MSLMRSETQVKARVFSGNEWSALTEATFITDADAASSTNLVVSKIHYRPSSATEEEIAAGHKNRNDFEYIELMNTGDKNIDLAGVLFEKGIDFKFDNGNSLVIEPNKRVLIVENLEAFNLRFGSNLSILGEFDNNSNLSNGGERILITAADGSKIHDFEYDDDSPWPNEADGTGYALVLRDPQSSPDHGLAENWKASSSIGGNPGEAAKAMSFEEWQVTNFSKSELDNTSISGPSANPDNDTLTNLEEFLSGSGPTSFDPSNALLNLKVEPSKGGNQESLQNAMIQIKLNSEARNSVSWKILVSQDGANWSDALSLLNFIETKGLDNGNEIVVYKIKDPSKHERLLFKIETTQ